MSCTLISSRMDTSDHGLPQLINDPGSFANVLTGVGEMSLRFHFELSGFLSVLIHRGLKDRRRVKVGALPRKLFDDIY
jgi:hypothetical protein